MTRTFQENRHHVADIFHNDLNAHRIAEVEGPNKSELTFWMVGGRMVITQVFRQGGWDHYVQGKHNNVDLTIRELKALNTGT